MLIFFSVYLLICLINIKPYFKSGYDYLSKDVTTSVKGIFILLVFFSHFNSYVNYNSFFDRLYMIPFSYIGQAMVTMFLFYSGYGVMEQIKKRDDYVSSMPVNRILNTLFQFSLAVCIYAVLNLVLNQSFTAKTFFLSLIGWESLGNSNWYIFAILCLYLITYISFKLFSGNFKKAAVLSLLITVAYIIVMRYVAHKPSRWHNTVLVYPLGVFWSVHRDKVDKIIKNNIVCIFLFFIALFSYFAIGFSYFKNIVFAIGFLLFTSKIKIGNSILNWCGKYLFEIFILQRIPMIILSEIGFLGNHIYISFVTCTVSTIFLSLLFRVVSSRLWNLIFKRRA